MTEVAAAAVDGVVLAAAASAAAEVEGAMVEGAAAALVDAVAAPQHRVRREYWPWAEKRRTQCYQLRSHTVLLSRRRWTEAQQ